MQFPERFTAHGLAQHVYTQPSGVGKDGKPYGGGTKISLSAFERLKNGEAKLVTFDLNLGELSAADAEKYRKLVGKTVSAPVTVYSIDGRLVVSLAEGGDVREAVAG